MLPAQLRLGPVQLSVRDLDRAIEWHERSLGLRLHRREDAEAELGDGQEAIVVLHEDPEAQPAGRHAGLYHYALLYPSREELARAATRLANLGSAAFVSAGGYHHHVAFNTWRGEGLDPRPSHTVGLDHWTVELPTAEDLAEIRGRVDAAGRPIEGVDGGFRVRDPWEIAVDFMVA